MLRSTASKVMWVGRATVFVVGLSMILALVLGVATMAFGANGDFFKVGKGNLASAVSVLTKSGAGPALDLRVGSGPPLRVNSDTRITNLNSDKLDGLSSGAFEPNSNGIAYGPFPQFPQGTGGTPIKVADVGYMEVYVACDTDGVPGRTRTHVFVPEARTPFAMTQVSSAGNTTLVESGPGDNSVTLMQTEGNDKMVTTSGALLTKGGEDKQVTFDLYQHRIDGLCTFGGHVMKGN